MVDDDVDKRTIGMPSRLPPILGINMVSPVNISKDEHNESSLGQN